MNTIRIFLVELWQNLWLTKTRVRQVLVTFVAVLVSTGIGIRYANEALIYAAPILLWLYSILICFAVLYQTQKFQWVHLKPTRTWIGLSLLLVVAFFLRVVNLQDLPPAFHPDEAGSTDFALRHVFHPSNSWLTINPLRTGLDSQPILYSYVLWLNTAVFGFSTMGARMSSVIIGTLAIAAVFLMMNELGGRTMAWLTSIFMTAYHYHIHWSRIALSNIWVTLLIPLTLGFFLRGWRKRDARGALLAGLCLGLTAYFYTGGYILIFLVATAIWQTWRNSKDHIRLAVYTGRMLSLAIVIAAPLIAFSFIKPDHFFDRLNVIFGWTRTAIDSTQGETTSYWEYFIYQFTHSFGAYNYYPDVTGFYAPQIPFLIGVSSLLFLTGTAYAIYKKQYFAVFWVFLVTVFGGVMVAGTPGSSHFVPVIPAICWLVAIPLEWVSKNAKPYLAYILLAVVVIVDLWFYFGIYAANPSANFSVPFPSVEPYTH